jgi:hypothetical protein
MTNLIRSVTNTSSMVSQTLFVPGYDPENPVVLAPSATLDLLSVVSAETLHAMQPGLNLLISQGAITTAATIPSANLWPAANPSTEASVNLPHVVANFGPTTLFTVPSTGMYQINYYIVNTTSGSGGDSVGQLIFTFVDPSGSNDIYANMPSGTNATLLGNGTAAVFAVAGSNITWTEGSGVFAGGLVMNISASIVSL